MSRIWKWLVLLLSLIFLVAGWLYLQPGPKEEDLMAKVKAGLDRPEFSNVSVSSQGQKGILSGSVATPALKEEAEKIAKEQWKGHSIENRIEVAGETKAQASAQGAPKEGGGEPPEKKLEEFFKTALVEFDPSGSQLTDSSKKILDQAAELLGRFPEKKLEIQGHTDNAGGAAVNLKLSGVRARAVYAYLVEKGVAAQRLTAKGYGEAHPIADNKTAEGRKLNRRVGFQLQ